MFGCITLMEGRCETTGGLWKGGTLKDEFENLGIYHPDDMSDHILKTAIQELREAEFQSWAKRGKKDGEEEV